MKCMGCGKPTGSDDDEYCYDCSKKMVDGMYEEEEQDSQLFGQIVNLLLFLAFIAIMGYLIWLAS